ncbi:uncharacterized protein [Macrobrachium rosenbergii]|uniref:uncharacterized protein n=1 Tax=Macrobrachium rosenbergii TaxID=79674 RepID=UPI0034D795A2
MSMPARTLLGLCFGVLVIMMSVSPAPALTIHPAVLKNFVGPFRKQGEPVLRPTFFDRPRMVGQRLVNRSGQGVNIPAAVRQSDYYGRQLTEGDASIVDGGQEAIYPAAIRGPQSQDEWNRSLRSCKGSGSCSQNMDNTLNLLMRMMETGKR